MKQLYEKEFNELFAYGGEDGNYYRLLDNMFYVAVKVKNRKVVASKQFGNMKDAEIWLSKLK